MIIGKKFKVLLVALLVIFILSSISYGQPIIEDIQARINHSMKISLNGQDFVYTDPSSGVELNPIIYENRTYLPVRAISEALKVAVDYDTETDTVILGERLEGIPFIDAGYQRYHTLMEATRDQDILRIGDISYKSGFFDLKPTGRSTGITFDTNNKYQKMEFKVFVVDDDLDYHITIKDQDNVVLKHLDVNSDDGIIEVKDVDIGSTTTVKIQIGYKSFDAPDKILVVDGYFK